MPGWTGMTHYVSPIGRDSAESVLPHHKNSNTVWYSTISSVPVVSRSTCEISDASVLIRHVVLICLRCVDIVYAALVGIRSKQKNTVLSIG